jgi:hypothetical protein
MMLHPTDGAYRSHFSFNENLTGGGTKEITDHLAGEPASYTSCHQLCSISEGGASGSASSANPLDVLSEGLQLKHQQTRALPSLFQKDPMYGDLDHHCTKETPSSPLSLMRLPVENEILGDAELREKCKISWTNSFGIILATSGSHRRLHVNKIMVHHVRVRKHQSTA